MPIPDVIVEQHGSIYVARDDLLPGGTKRRFLEAFVKLPYDEFVYATPAEGGAQVALAHACASNGKLGHVFVAARAEMHPKTKIAKDMGCRITQIRPGYLGCVQARAKEYANLTGALALPWGLDTPQCFEAIANDARKLVDKYGQFDELWCAVGSGVLIRSLQLAGVAREYYGIVVGAKGKPAGAARLIEHPLRFSQDAKIKPPYPSASNYDAKVWEYVRNRKGKILVWNVMA